MSGSNCPNCGASLKGSLCEYCGSAFDVTVELMVGKTIPMTFSHEGTAYSFFMSVDGVDIGSDSSVTLYADNRVFSMVDPAGMHVTISGRIEPFKAHGRSVLLMRHDADLPNPPDIRGFADGR